MDSTHYINVKVMLSIMQKYILAAEKVFIEGQTKTF